MILRLFTMLIAMLCIAPRIARADSEPIALLPLDADGRLEIYGQPIAAEIARALTDGKLTVVVVEAKMAVPDGTKLVVAGSITAKGTAVVLGVQVRNPADGTVTDKLEEPAANVAAIGKAAAKLAERLAPVVKARLEVLRKVVVPDRKPPPVRPQVVEPVVLLGVGVSMNASLIVEPFRQALIDSVNRTLRANQRQPSPVDASTLGAQLAVQTVATARASRGIVFEILDYAIEPGMIPLVRARVRVRIADGTRVQFDETLATDTIVGDKLSPPGVLAFRTAREIMTILRPHLRKLEPRWR